MINRIREGYGALSKDTELLTPTGWLNITKVTTQTLVAQYSKDGHIGFTKPIYVRMEKPKKAVHIYNKSRHYDQLVGIHHAIPFLNTRNNCLMIMSARQVTRNSERKYLHTGVLVGGSIKEISPLDRLRIAFQADGTTRYSTENYDRVEFGFVKERKIERLHNLLKESNTNYKWYKRKDGRTFFSFPAPIGFYEKDFRWVDLTDVSQSWCQEFIEEISHWDSHVYDSVNFSFSYYNNRKLAIDQVQAVATLAGYKTAIHTKSHIDSNRQTRHILNVCNGSKSTISISIEAVVVDYFDVMYGVFVNTGMLVVRRNNSVSIAGCNNHAIDLSKYQIINTDCGHLA